MTFALWTRASPGEAVRGLIRVLWFALLLALVHLTQGCDASRSTSDNLLEFEALPELQITESSVIGGFGAEGAYALGAVNSVALLLDQSAIAVADGTVQEIHLFGLDGQHLGKTGRKGGGPGEFRALRQMRGLPDGRLSVWDVQQSRVTVFGSDLQLLASSRADLEPVQAMLPEFVGFLPDGQFVLRDRRDAMGMKELAEGMRQDTVRLYLYSDTGRFLDTLAVLLDEPKWFRNRDGSWGAEDLIFGHALTSLVVGSEVWVGSSAAVTFTRYRENGTVVGDVELNVVMRGASPRDIEEERERRLSNVHVNERFLSFDGGPPGLQEALVRMADAGRESIREVASNNTIPAYDLAIPGSDGVLWLRQYPLPQDTMALWVLIDDATVPRGTLRLPRSTAVQAASLEWLVVVERDAYDAPVVRVLQVHHGSRLAK